MADNKIMNFIIYTLNCNNKLITTEFINDIMIRFKINTKRRQTYKVKNIEYFITAKTHKKYSLNLFYITMSVLFNHHFCPLYPPVYPRLPSVFTAISTHLSDLSTFLPRNADNFMHTSWFT